MRLYLSSIRREFKQSRGRRSHPEINHAIVSRILNAIATELDTVTDLLTIVGVKGESELQTRSTVMLVIQLQQER